MKKIYLAILVGFATVFCNAQEFTFGTIPDTQNLTENDGDAGRIMDMTGFYVAERDRLNLKFVASLGDMTQWGDYGQWQRVRNAYDLLKNDNLPYAPCQGNHDPQLDRFNQFFPESEFIGTPTYGGNFRGMENAYYLFSEAGMDFIVVVLQSHDNYIGHYDLESIQWANDILTQYADRRAIFVTHDFFEERGLIDDVIRKHDNLFLAVCGHSCQHHGEYRWTETTPGGNTVQCIMTDYQCRQNNKAAIVRYYTFKPNENKVYAYSYDAFNRTYLTASSSQFSFDYEMNSTPCEDPHQAYQNIVANIPGTVEAENYNEGCPGVPYFDTSAANEGGEYRANGVDIEACDEGGFNVGWTEAGEWLNYQVNVLNSGAHTFQFRVASLNGGGIMHLEIDDVDISGPITINATNGWQNWVNVEVNNVHLNAGLQHLKLVIDAGGFNLNHFTGSFEGNNAPVIAGVTHSPETPQPSDNPLVSASITDDGEVQSATILWGLSSGNLNNQIIMSANGNQYSGNIPSQIEGTTVYYMVVASDGINQSSSQEYAYTVASSTGPVLVWSDEFNYSGLPDPSKWGYDTGNGGFGNNELQNYTANRLENARVENGSLIIEARRDWHEGIEYSSARLVTRNKGDWLYGRVEARAKLPGGRGTWAAIWMLPTDWEYGGWPDSGEIDIMENVGYDPETVHGTVHTEAYNHILGTQLANTVDRTDFQSEFHVYAIEWEENKIDFLLDDEIYFTFSRHGGSAEWPFDKRFHLILNLAVGGNWGGALGVDPNIWPQRMEVDYVRVYDNSYGNLTANLPGTVEAEHYAKASGIRNEECSEGGLNVGYLDAGDYLVYDVNVATAGNYLVEYRIASDVGGGVFNLEQNSGSTVLGTMNIPNTGGWQTWQTVSHTVSLSAGPQEVAIGVETGGFNINYIKFTHQGTPPVSVHIEAEDYTIMEGIQTEPCSEGGENIGWTTTNDWVVYNAEIPAGNYEVNYRVASQTGGAQIQIEKAGGSAVYGQVNVGATGGWQSWTTVTHFIDIPEPLTQIALKFTSGGVNVNWIELTATSGARSEQEVFSPGTDQSILLSPNPANSLVRISGINQKISDLSVIGVDGKVHTLHIRQTNQEVELDISGLKKGLYLIKLNHGDQHKILKFIKN